MMAIGSMTGENHNMQAGSCGINMQTDSVSRNIQNQIANAQKRMQELSSNEELTLEEKMKKRQEIQQEIASLNGQLRQRQMEQRKERQSEGMSMDDILGGNRRTETAKTGGKGSGSSQAGMQTLSKATMAAMISADSSMKQAHVQGSVAVGMEGRAGVLKSEIKMDQGRGISTKQKEDELAETEQKAVNAAASQMNMLADANQTLKEVKTAESSRSEEESAKAKQSGEEESAKAKQSGEEESAKAKQSGEEKSEAAAILQPVAYTPIDVRL